MELSSNLLKLHRKQRREEMEKKKLRNKLVEDERGGGQREKVKNSLCNQFKTSLYSRKKVVNNFFKKSLYLANKIEERKS